MSTISQLRTTLTQKRIDLRHNQRCLEDIKRVAEDAIIADAGGEKGLGPNAEARTRTLAAGLAKQVEYQAGLATVQALQDHIEGIATDLENAVDERRDREWAIRERLAAALDGRLIVPRDVEDPVDEVIDEEVMRQVTAAMLQSAQPTDEEFAAIAQAEAIEFEALTRPGRKPASEIVEGPTTGLDREAILEAARLADVMDGARW